MDKKNIANKEDFNVITDKFVEKYKNKKINWGFNGLGYLVYKRTYSRTKENGELEEWHETIRRCINGAQKIGAKYTQQEAEKLYDLMFHFKCIYPGRMLWQLGTSTVDRYGGNSLLNCWVTTVNDVSAFEFIFDNLMLGGGVGYSIRREHVHELPKIKKGVKIFHQSTKDADIICPDSRTGWVRLLHSVFKSFFDTGKSFSYSTILVRGAGEPIKGFGGTASGPQILIDGITKICNIFVAREGKKLRSIDALDICNIIGSIVVAGNVRRSAQIALGDPDDFLFLRAKRWDLGNIPNWRSMSNNTIFADDYEHISEDVWNGYKGNGEPYGFFNLPLCQKYGRLGEEINDENIVGVNPCLCGDTLVYVADGRGNVPIKQLAEENKDVPVFCYDKNQNITIRYLRHPRVTGFNKEIYKITLDDGSTFKATSNHKVLLTDGLYKEVHNLIHGDSLKIITKYEASFEEIFEQSNSRSQDYFWLNNGKSSSKAEHRLIAEFHYNKKIPTGYVVHHKDYNSQNNTSSNLEVLSKSDHDDLHSCDMIGDKNPMRRAQNEWNETKWADYKRKQSKSSSGDKNGRFSGYTNDELMEHAIILTRKLNRRFSIKEWQNYAKQLKLPINFSKWRKDHLGSILGIAKRAALDLGLENINEDPRVVKTYKSALNEGYDAEIINGEVFVNKLCEVSGARFKAPYSRREISILGRRESNLKSWKNQEIRQNRIKGIRKFHQDRQEIIRQKQTEIYSKLSFQLNRLAMKKEWEEECAKLKISFEIGRKTSPFKSFEDLQESTKFFNHKVVSVEFVGLENVYNGTVDEFHNFFIGGFSGTTQSGKRKWVYINNLQCGEIPMEKGECCNLSELCLNNIDTKEELFECAKLLYKTQKAISALPFIHDITNKVVHKNMRLGMGVTGICQSLEKIGWLDECYLRLKAFDKEWSRQNNLNTSIKLTTVKPSGTVSLLSGSTPGVHPAFSRYYIRRIRMSSNDSLVSICRESGFHVEYVLNFDGSESRDTVVVEVPCESSGNTILAKDMSAVKQLELVKELQAKWADNAISVTVYYKKEELSEIKEWLKNNYKQSIKSVSFLLHKDHNFKQSPYEEITEEKYKELVKKIKPIYNMSISTNGNLDVMECSNGACPIK